MANPNSNEDTKIPFRIRFQAWWNGVDAGSLLLESDGGDYEAHPEAIHFIEEPEEELEYWNPVRIEFLNKLWGGTEQREIVSPGGADFNIELAQPMGLDASKTVLDLAAGLGGATRALVNEFKVWIEGLESDADLAVKANELSRKYGMSRRAPIKSFEPENFDLKENRYDAIILRESMYKFKRKDQMLSKIYKSLKPGGHLMLTDFALKSQLSPDNPEVAKWLASLNDLSFLWTMDDYKQAVLKSRMNVHIHENKTDVFKDIVLRAWTGYVETLGKDDLNRHLVNQLMTEAQHWLLLVNALETGELRFMRIHATKGHESIL